MCGRFALELIDLSEMPEWLAADHELVVDWQPRFNIAPSQDAPILLARPERALVGARWGLLPKFVREPAEGNRFINARVETVAKASAFRDSFRHRRCVVPATGLLAGAVAAALPACWVEVLVITAGFTAPFELMLASTSVEKPESSSAMRLLRCCSQL